MEEDKVVESIPTETIESDDDFFADVDDEVETEEAEASEGKEESKPNETQESEDDVDYEPLLKALSGKIKYNIEEVNVESIDDLISNYQKGLNYDKKVQELENLQNSKLEKYAKSKADELGITVEEYMDRVEKYEEDQKRAQEEQEKNQEDQKFLEKFPDVNPEDIPKEVFEDAEKSSLSEAYMKWQLGELKKKLEVAQKNEKNANATVGSVTDTGPTNENHTKDLFLEGFYDGD